MLQNKVNHNADSAMVIKEEEQSNEIIKVDVSCDTFKNESVEVVKEVNIPNKVLEAISCNEITVPDNSRVCMSTIMGKSESSTLPDCRILIRQPKRMYSCNLCNFSCREYSKWQNHRRTYHYAPGICNICGKSMRTDNLLKHVRSHSALPVPCKVCGKVFKNSDSLRSHSFTHRGIEHTCTICGKTYNYKGELTRHIRRQHGIK